MTTTAPERKPLDGMQLNYRGDLRGRIEGQVIGPNLLREWFVILATDYDPAADRTTARVAFATLNDFAASKDHPVRPPAG